MPLAEDTEIREWLKLNAGTSNEILSKGKERVLRSMLLDERQSLSGLDLEIGHLESLLANLYEKRKSCIHQIDRYSVGLSPQKHIPSEILANIFLHSMLHERALLPPKRSESPWVFLWVCSRWRQVALEEHRLWNYLDVQGKRLSSIREIVTSWLPLLWTPTQSFPISLSLGAADKVLPLRDILLSQTHRLCSISLDTFLKVTSEFLFASPMVFDTLESLELFIRLGSSSVGVPSSQYATFPKLKKVTIDDPTLGFASRSIFFRLPWTQVSHLTLSIRVLTFSTLEDIVTQCDNLASLSFLSYYMNPLSDPTFGSSREINLPDLQSLTILTNGHVFDVDVLEYLRVPSLKEFSVDHRSAMNRHSRAFWNQAMFDNMLRRSQCSLTSLNLLGGLRTLSFEILLPELTSLVTLVVSISDPIPDTIFDKMIQGEVLGKLEHLECFTSSPIPFLRLLEYQCEHLTGGKFRGLSFANISYGVLETTEDIEDFEEIYDRLKPNLGNGEKEIILNRIETNI
ncbi:hypothetical protein BDZ94DRAFT_1325210 [Collybia nuda]|uniref:F-box domain-containing protein n=1 Tax=Collybia nuda TaxID=64659 RepID=A0A9P6CAV3_9AGAR|nr:hypothetical protein BDZ94DRAFT_1325210 [Collybia nuda]